VSILDILQQYCPADAVPYCYQLWQKDKFIFRIKKDRRSKLGDYRFIPGSATPHHISINHTLNSYSFLITYIHEVAHLHTFSKYKRKVLPHGKEWKRSFRQLMLPLLNEGIFPPDILLPLQLYMQNPKASSCSDMALFKALQVYSVSAKPLLLELSTGETFVLHGRVFEKGLTRRTRVVCRESSTGKQYSISAQAPVERLSNE
jgi:SprT protein